jgi:hypothetical protein
MLEKAMEEMKYANEEEEDDDDKKVMRRRERLQSLE